MKNLLLFIIVIIIFFSCNKETIEPIVKIETHIDTLFITNTDTIYYDSSSYIPNLTYDDLDGSWVFESLTYHGITYDDCEDSDYVEDYLNTSIEYAEEFNNPDYDRFYPYSYGANIEFNASDTTAMIHACVESGSQWDNFFIPVIYDPQTNKITMLNGFDRDDNGYLDTSFVWQIKHFDIITKSNLSIEMVYDFTLDHPEISTGSGTSHRMPLNVTFNQIKE